MAKYRIVKMRGCESLYKVQIKIFGFLWIDTIWDYKSFDNCEWFIKDRLKIEKIKKDNPRDIVIAEYN
jgi:hypothetical protein